MTLKRESEGVRLIDHADPLPKKRITTTSGVGGAIKARPEDFIVDEIPLYEPTGSGEHLYLRVQKIDVSHGEAVTALARHFGVSERRIGFAGMKDKRAVTQQTFSVHTKREWVKGASIHDRIRVLWAARHQNKLRRGHLVGNRFSIRVRDVQPTDAPRAHEVLAQLERTGVPNYFGEQRFGYRCNTHLLGRFILRREWQPLLDELLGTSGTPFPEHQREQRERYERGDYRGALTMWSASDPAERAALRALGSGADARRACLSIGRRGLSFYVSAVQSAIFNSILDERIESGTLARLLPGDLAWKHDSRAVFEVTDEILRDHGIDDRLARLEISPSGPLWGPGMTRASCDVGRLEEAALRGFGITPDDLAQSVCHLEGTRRPLRVPVTNIDVEGGADEHGPYIRLQFDLPRGSYATVVLREILEGAVTELPELADP